MTIIIAAAESASPRIGYQNLFESASSVSASSEASGYEGSNAYNWDTASYWKPSSTGTFYLTATMAAATDADYFAIYAHNLHTYGASVKLQYSTNGSSWSDATSSQAPSTGRPIFVSFDTISAGWWRIELVTNSGPAQIGFASFGEALIFPWGMRVGFSPATLSRYSDVMNSTSEGGQLLGRSLLRSGARNTIECKLVTPTWARESWLPFIQHAEIKPFVFSWNWTSYPNEAAFCFTDGQIPPVTYSTYTGDGGRMDVRLPVNALIE